jgi:hypothetical protein
MTRRQTLLLCGVLSPLVYALADTLAGMRWVPMRPRGAEQGLLGAMHLAEGMVAMVILVGAMAFAAAALGRRFRAYTVLTIGVMVVFGAWSMMDAPRIEAGLATPWVGVKERVFWYAYQLWFIVLALKLLYEQPSSAALTRR